MCIVWWTYSPLKVKSLTVFRFKKRRWLGNYTSKLYLINIRYSFQAKISRLNFLLKRSRLTKPVSSTLYNYISTRLVICSLFFKIEIVTNLSKVIKWLVAALETATFNTICFNGHIRKAFEKPSYQDGWMSSVINWKSI